MSAYEIPTREKCSRGKNGMYKHTHVQNNLKALKGISTMAANTYLEMLDVRKCSYYSYLDQGMFS